MIRINGSDYKKLTELIFSLLEYSSSFSRNVYSSNGKKIKFNESESIFLFHFYNSIDSLSDLLKHLLDLQLKPECEINDFLIKYNYESLNVLQKLLSDEQERINKGIKDTELTRYWQKVFLLNFKSCLDKALELFITD